jgi:predicted GNAT superfamily acetyltransferase
VLPEGIGSTQGDERRASAIVRELVDLSEMDDARRLFDAVWPSIGGSTQIQSNLLRAIAHAGGYLSGAYVDDELVGAAMAFVGRHEALGRWRVHLHSHMAAVLPEYRDRHIGSLLKQHQRQWALARDIDTIVWTFDPLVRRNAVVNVVKLGVDVRGYEIDFYGSMDDEINQADPSDRLFAWWQLSSPKALAAARGELGRLDPIECVVAGRDVIEIELPEDITALRQTQPDVAAEWRLAVREALVAAFSDGFEIVGISPAGGYVLERVGP